MGDSEFRGRQHVSIYVEHAWGDAIVATWVETQSRERLRHPGSWRRRAGLRTITPMRSATAETATAPMNSASRPSNFFLFQQTGDLVELGIELGADGVERC